MIYIVGAESIALLTHRGVATSTSEESTKPQRHFFSKFDTALVDKRSLGTMAFQFFFVGHDLISRDISWSGCSIS